MRLAHYFLALYTVLLSCIPCQDDVIMLYSHDDSSQTAIGTHEKQDSRPIDLCSPFCICACCAGITIAQPTVYSPEMHTFLFSKENRSMYSPQVTSHDLASIWQPPRV